MPNYLFFSDITLLYNDNLYFTGIFTGLNKITAEKLQYKQMTIVYSFNSLVSPLCASAKKCQITAHHLPMAKSFD